MNTLIYIHKQQLTLHLHRYICNSYDYSNIYKDIYTNILVFIALTYILKQ